MGRHDFCRTSRLLPHTERAQQPRAERVRKAVASQSAIAHEASFLVACPIFCPECDLIGRTLSNAGAIKNKRADGAWPRRPDGKEDVISRGSWKVRTSCRN